MSLFPLIGNQVALSTSAPVATDNYCNGVLISTGGVARAATSGGAQYSQGFLMSNTGQVIYTDATAGLPGGTTYSEGIPQTSTGAICISTDAPTTWSNGLPFALNGALSALVSVLELDFLSGALDSRITFTRASSGTFFGTDGLLKTQGYNLLTFSSTFTNAAWSKTDVTPTLSDSSPLDVGYLMTEGSAGTAICSQDGAAITAGATVTVSIVAKRGNTDWVRFVGRGSGLVNGCNAWFNLATGVKGVVSNNGTGSGWVSTQTPLGGGWYRLTVTGVIDATSTIPAIAVISATADNSTTRVNNATYYVSAAQLEVGTVANTYSPTTTAANGGARFDNDPATLRPLGLLIEEQRTNLLLQSRDMTQAAWSKTDVTPTRNQVGIDGTANSACLMTEGSAGTALTSQNGSAVTAGSTVTGSLVLKRGNTDWLKLGVINSAGTAGIDCWFNTATGATSNVAGWGGSTNNSASVTNLGGGFYRVVMTTTPDGTYTIPRITIQSAITAGSATRVSGATYIVDCAQLEVGSFASSIITTGAATVTRAADSASMTGTNFSSWAGTASVGTTVLEAYSTATPNTFFCSIGDGTGNAYIGHRWTGSQYTGVRRGPGGTPSGDVGTGVGTLSANPFKFALAWNASGGAVSFNGGTVVSDATAGAVPVSVELAFGKIQSSGAAVSQQWIRRLTYYPTRLANATLQALTL